MTLIEFICVCAVIGFIFVLLLVIVMLGLLSRRITKLEEESRRGYSNPVYG